jgi:hypothetical protein
VGDGEARRLAADKPATDVVAVLSLIRVQRSTADRSWRVAALKSASWWDHRGRGHEQSASATMPGTTEAIVRSASLVHKT